jgi:O-antigen ligase
VTGFNPEPNLANANVFSPGGTGDPAPSGGVGLSPGMRRTATAAMLVGLVAVVVSALPYHVFELDRFFAPKELVLHGVAAALAILLVAGRRGTNAGIVDALLVAFLVWSVASAVMATNLWLAQRAIAITASSLVLFWTARRLGMAGAHRPVIGAAAFATVIAAATGLAQAYGFDTDYFSRNRAPGGTFGNRNFVAHFGAIGLPALVHVVSTARTAMVAGMASVGTAGVVVLLVLTRSRAAWLAVAASLVVAFVGLLAARRYWRGTAAGPRLVWLTVIAGAAIALAIIAPNSLNWRSDSPYLESALGVVDYGSGSGRGRLNQYRNSLEMTARQPVFGVGAGNWPIEYVRFAPAGDESLASDGQTANPWPSSDWVAFVSERGAVAGLALAGALAALFLGAFRRWNELTDADAVFAKLTLAATITATAVVSMFDAVLLLAAPAFLAWTMIGATSGVGPASPADATGGRGGSQWWRAAAIMSLVLVSAGFARSAGQVAAIVTVGTGASSSAWLDAVRWDPGSYRISLRAAELQQRRGRCASARAHATRARDLNPPAAAPRQVLRRCG